MGRWFCFRDWGQHPAHSNGGRQTVRGVEKKEEREEERGQRRKKIRKENAALRWQ